MAQVRRDGPPRGGPGRGGPGRGGPGRGGPGRGGPGRGGRRGRAERASRDDADLIEKLVGINRVDKVVLDRGGYLYHGRVKALAEAARENGLDF